MKLQLFVLLNIDCVITFMLCLCINPLKTTEWLTCLLPSTLIKQIFHSVFGHFFLLQKALKGIFSEFSANFFSCQTLKTIIG